jgi:hypothetical protein
MSGTVAADRVVAGEVVTKCRPGNWSSPLPSPKKTMWRRSFVEEDIEIMTDAREVLGTVVRADQPLAAKPRKG